MVPRSLSSVSEAPLALQPCAKHGPPTETTGAFGFSALVEGFGPVRDSQLIPTFCSVKRQHISSRSKRESSYFTRRQHYDDCGCITLEGASSRCLMRPAWLCDAARATLCAVQAAAALTIWVFFYPFIHDSSSPTVCASNHYLLPRLASRRLA